MSQPTTSSGLRSAARIALVAAVVGAAGYVLLIELAPVFVVAFCALLIALMLSTSANLFQLRGAVPHAVALGFVILLLLALVAGFIVWVGPQLANQLGQLQEQVQAGLSQARTWLESTQLGQRVQGWLPKPGELGGAGAGLLSETRTILSRGLTLLAYVLAVLFLGVFLAAAPSRYNDGLLCLIPASGRGRVARFLGASGHALRVWLLARLCLMTLVGIAFGVGLWLLDIPLALPLGILAGLLDFIPYIGPAIALIPAAAVALLESPRSALYVVILYLAVQFVESYVAQPLIEARAVSLPPALILIAQLVCSLWLGAVGLLVATPLLVAVVVGVQVFYQQGVLNQRTQLAGR